MQKHWPLNGVVCPLKFLNECLQSAKHGRAVFRVVKRRFLRTPRNHISVLTYSPYQSFIWYVLTFPFLSQLRFVVSYLNYDLCYYILHVSCYKWNILCKQERSALPFFLHQNTHGVLSLISPGPGKRFFLIGRHNILLQIL